MFRYRLRTLLLLTILGPPLLAGAWFAITSRAISPATDGWEPCTGFEFEITYPIDKKSLGGRATTRYRIAGCSHPQGQVIE